MRHKLTEDRWRHWVCELLTLRDETDYERQRAMIESLASYLADLEAKTEPGELPPPPAPEQEQDQARGFDHLLGTLPDRAVAELAGVSRHQAYSRRRALSIPAWAGWVDWETWDEHLGTVTDQELADRIGCTRSAVTNRRRDLELPSYRDRRLARRRREGR